MTAVAYQYARPDGVPKRRDFPNLPPIAELAPVPVRKGWGLMIGRFQPWHAAHRALFDKIYEMHPLGVVIGVRNTYNTTEKDPLTPEEVVSRIEKDLLGFIPSYRFQTIILPDIQGVYYGRDVGYAVEQLDLPLKYQSISASKIRKEQGL